MDCDRNITMFLHCRECLEDWKAHEAVGESPKTYARFSVGFTALGLQVICNRHDLNVIHIDFEGQQHPADQGREGDFGGTYWSRIEARKMDAQENLVNTLKAKGFLIDDFGGGTVALVRKRAGFTDVITTACGLRLPTADDWLLCTYDYDWQEDVGQKQPIDSLDSESSPVDLLAAVTLIGRQQHDG